MSRLLLGAEAPAEGAFDKRRADAPAGLFSWFGQLLERFYQHVVLPHNTATVLLSLGSQRPNKGRVFPQK